jgi:hypothetical protein
MSVGDAANGVADAGRDRLPGAFRRSVAESARHPAWPGGVTELSEEPFAFIGCSLVAG